MPTAESTVVCSLVGSKSMYTRNLKVGLLLSNSPKCLVNSYPKPSPLRVVVKANQAERDGRQWGSSHLYRKVEQRGSGFSVWAASKFALQGPTSVARCQTRASW